MKKTILMALLLTTILLVACAPQQQIEQGPLDDFVKCMKDNGVKMYGSMTCPVCARQKKLFSNSFKLLGEIECHPKAKNTESELCIEKEILKTPTWILEPQGQEEKRLEGYQSIETLAEFSGCPAPK
jgi:hypothetical protein